MTEEERHENLVKEFDRYDQMHIQNIINQDNVLAQLSVGLLAILATLGKQILIYNRILGYLVITFIGLTIIQVVLGYCFSNSFFVFVKKKLNTNYEKGIEPVTLGTDESCSGKINDFFNKTSHITFFVGMVIFCVLLILYLKSTS